MTNQHRDFDAARAERAGEPLTFQLDGYTFTTVDAVPAGPLLDLAAQADATDVAAFAAFGDFLVSIVIPEDAERFRAALHRTDLQTVFDVAKWVIEETTGRPLPQPSSSPAPSSEDGGSLKAVSLAPVTPKDRSA